MKDKRNTLSKLSAIALLVGLVGCGDNGSETYTDKNAVDTTLPSSDWRMIWQDEFDGTEIDSTKWSHEVNCSGGGNHEQQCYTDSADNSFVSEGNLNIVVLPNTDDTLSKDYTSARMNTRMKGDFTYGRFEVRAKLPAGQGSHPAFWMMPTDSTYGGWPHSGELDVVEAVNLKVTGEDGSIESNVHGTLHYGKTTGDNKSQNSGAAYLLPDDVNPADDFHVYAIEWQEGEIRWYVDGYLYQTQRKSETKLKFTGDLDPKLVHRGWYTADNYDIATGEQANAWDNAPFDKNFYMILNFAVGGSWAEAVNNTGIDASAFIEGNTMLVDYVRVYQCDIAPLTGEGCATIRAGYDEEASEDRPDGALVPGEAPSPPEPPLDPNAPAPPLNVFIDEVADGWAAWDDSGVSSPMETTDEDPDYDAVMEFVITGQTVVGFTTRSGHGVEEGKSFNASNHVATGTIEFDLKMIAAPATVVPWFFKIESDEGVASGAGTEAIMNLSSSVEGHITPELDTWQHYTFNLKDLVALDLDPSRIDVMMIFPEWGQGDGAKFRVDNFIISRPANGDATGLPKLVVFEDENNNAWPAWDCCGGTNPSSISDGATYGDVIEFSIGATDTVMGFSGRDVDKVFDASLLASTGTVEFDLKLISSPGDVPWSFKIESNTGTQDGAPGEDAEFSLSASNEGHAAPELDVWQHYTYDMADLVDAGIDPSGIDLLMIFPEWGNGSGAVYRVDNVIISAPEEITETPVPDEDPVVNDPEVPATTGTELMMFNNAINPAWPAWDCCAGSTPAVVIEGGDYGNVVEFSIGAQATVKGFMGRDNGSIFDASTIASTGVVEFDLKLVASPGDVVWNVKLESNGGTEGDATGQAVELVLSANNEGHAAPELGVWQHYSFDLADFVAAGIDPSGIDIFMIFPAWDTGNGAIYQVDNVRIGE